MSCKQGKDQADRDYVSCGGHLYIYLIYGMHWMLNIVTGRENDPQAVLIRGVSGISGPGRVARNLELTAGGMELI
ncbi:MAG: DNA-3-methyladenine glycosylase [Bacteroidales bacterium]